MSDTLPEIKLVDLQRQYLTIRDEVIEAIDAALCGMELNLGPNVRAFEREFAAYCEAAEGIGVGSGTDALYLAIRACEIGPGDEVITVANTFIATVEAIVMAGARPVFVDVDPLTQMMDPALVEAAITPRTRAILPVHLFGQAADMTALRAIASAHKLWLIEDASQAQGARFEGRPVGDLGDIAAFSLYFSKNLGGYGESGIVTTSNPELAERVRMLRNHGSQVRYYHDLIGMNSRLDEIQAAVLRIKLRRLEEWNAARRQHASAYGERLRGVVETPFERADAHHVYYTYVIQTDDRDALKDALAAEGVATGIHYPLPLHLQRACADFALPEGALPVSERLATRILSLPMFPELREDEIDRVCDLIRARARVAVR
ncbi:MAG TPA: DegT/DnrJ/EryC1/StrS family aminotransferase [Ktedonobacterales bacterium]|nr:DegT/DnrJ/EryC1/StrS family aminotransferase [Ktedonobacterales bacterium]